MSAWAEIRAGRREALAFLRIGDDFSPSQCMLFLRALRVRLENELRGVHDPEDRKDHKEMLANVNKQIAALRLPYDPE